MDSSSPPPRPQSYQPTLSLPQHPTENDDDQPSTVVGVHGDGGVGDDAPAAAASSSSRPKRQKSLVRPERERIDEHHRQYHYRHLASATSTRDRIEPSTTGSRPSRSTPKRYTSSRGIDPNAPVRRGQSILGRNEKRAEQDDVVASAIDLSMSKSKRKRCGCSNLWMTYCRIITCCIPGPLLQLAGIPKGQAQMAWREKIGLLSFIACVMGFVGFLTFGFTQTVCPTPPMTVQGGAVSPGYLIIRGWAYMLANWNAHPPIPGQTSDPTNILYAPIDAGGMDASFLFQERRPAVCENVFPPKQPASSSWASLGVTQQTPTTPEVYFPCQMFNPNDTSTKSLATSTSASPCHLSNTARTALQQFQTQGIPKADGSGFDKIARVYYTWESINSTDFLMVYNGDVLNLKLLELLSSTQYDIKPDSLISQILNNRAAFGGRDMTRYISTSRRQGMNWEQEAKCLATLIKVGSIDTLSIGCMASEIVLYLSLVVILGVILARFSLAVIFGWCLSWRLGNFKEERSYTARMQREAELERWTQDIHTAAPLGNRPSAPVPPQMRKRSLLPQTSRFTQPLPNSTRFDAERPPTPIWKTPSSTLEDYTVRRFSQYQLSPSPSPSSRHLPALNGNNITLPGSTFRRSSISSSEAHSNSGGATLIPTPTCPYPLSPHALPQPPQDYMPFNYPLAHTICLVTCYSEGMDGVRTTLDSIATSDYPNSHKLILVVCDGLITGHGESMSTPDVCVAMMRDFLVPPDQVEAGDYIAIADGSKRNNMAKVYAGFYKYDDETVDPAHQQRVPMITVVKCGTPAEADEKKPGNRGKRDSQIILMQFMQKVLFDERMTTMEYTFFNSIWQITGIPPDRYEIVLMVDADTKLFPDALSRLVSCAVKDPEITGLCGETRIANKTQSWVSAIQVFEYYISHHQSKAFESIFGGVTCLPGCFCMYRIKAPKGPNGYWVPILANPDIVEHYSENVVDTLHKKNLLLLGEDRYLSTLMLKTFPNRKMMFVPQAVCKTIVPDTFRVLLSQRRRWINSTIHNLMELVLVHDLCGTFCFSMQFVVFMELVGTLALPAAISFTLYLIILAILGRPAIIPLLLLALILGLPAVLIVMTSRKILYVGWMIVYLFSLPIWNFVLPTYAYWHFDDFSWGDTRKVEGGGKDKGGHGDKEGEFDASRATMKKWSEYEKERRIRQAVEMQMPIPRFKSDSMYLPSDDSLLLKPPSPYYASSEPRYSPLSEDLHGDYFPPQQQQSLTPPTPQPRASFHNNMTAAAVAAHHHPSSSPPSSSPLQHSPSPPSAPRRVYAAQRRSTNRVDGP